MNRTQATTLAAVIALATVTVSAHEHQHSDAQPPATGTGSAVGIKAPGMHEHMQKMQQQMEKIRATNDPQERDRLVQEHMKSMQEGMKMMHHMGGPMMGGGKGGPGAMSGESRGRHEMMAQCMDMMQKMGSAAGEHGKQP